VAPIAAAFLPHPPLLVPGLAGTAAAELDPLRAACREALVTVTAAGDLTILVGTGPIWAVPAPSALGSFRPYGADLEVTLPALTNLELPAALTDNDLPGLPPHLAELPLSLAIAAHLLTSLDRPPTTRLAAFTVPATLGSSAAATIGHALAAAGPTPAAVGRVGLVVMGDLSACRTDRAPGGLRHEAAAFDASISEAFRSATPDRLLDLDPTQAAGLLVSGRAPLQVLAGAFEQLDQTGGARERQGQPARGARHARAPTETGPDAILGQTGPELRGRVLYEAAPYGVGYLVAILTAP
jgi:hypothetical protein